MTLRGKSCSHFGFFHSQIYFQLLFLWVKWYVDIILSEFTVCLRRTPGATTPRHPAHPSSPPPTILPSRPLPRQLQRICVPTQTVSSDWSALPAPGCLADKTLLYPSSSAQMAPPQWSFPRALSSCFCCCFQSPFVPVTSSCCKTKFLRCKFGV